MFVENDWIVILSLLVAYWANASIIGVEVLDARGFLFRVLLEITHCLRVFYDFRQMHSVEFK